MSRSPHLSLQHAEAIERFDLLEVASYDVALDLDRDEETFGSVTTIRFRSRGGATFVDLKPVGVNAIRLNDVALDVDSLDRGRMPLQTVAGENELVVDAVMRFRNDGEGLHRSVDPADGRHYVYGMSFMDAAPSIFACFDQPDLKAPFTLHVRAPRDWVVLANAAGDQVEPGLWDFPTTRPLSTYFVTLVAGPYHLIADQHDGIPLSLSCRQSIAGALETDAAELFTLTRQCFDELHRLFGIRYPFGSYHQAFVPEFNAGAMENPGCVTFRDPLVFTSQVTRGTRITRATTIAHEMAHQWFGNLTTPKWWDDLWLNESFAEYLGTRVTAEVTEYDDAWLHNSYLRRQWGLIADAGPATHPVAGNGAADAVSALQDFDGISYVKGSSVLRQLNGRLGDPTFFAGVVDHFASHRFGNATMHDLLASWEGAGAGDLGDVVRGWLRGAGPDTVVADRTEGVVRRTPPAGDAGVRQHSFHVASAGADGAWRLQEVRVGAEPAAVELAPGEALLLDVYDESWLLAVPDRVTLDRLPDLMATTEDPALRAAAWNNVRTGFERGAVDPETVLEIAAASIPIEGSELALAFNAWAGTPSKALLPEWLITTVAQLSAEPARALGVLHDAFLTRVHSAPRGSTLQLAAFQGAVTSATAPERVAGWLAGEVPDGVQVDLALRWRLLGQLAALGAAIRARLDQELAAEPTATSRVEHARAVASMPTAEAKTWAWARFTGLVDVPNYELQAAGQGMWRPGQERLTQEYAKRFFDDLPATAARRSGWVLAEAASWFFPLTALGTETVDRAEELAGDASLDRPLRRQMAVLADEVRRRTAARELARARVCGSL